MNHAFDPQRFSTWDAWLREALDLDEAGRERLFARIADEQPEAVSGMRRLLARADEGSDALSGLLDGELWAGLADDDARGQRFGAWRARGTLAHGGMARVLHAERADGGYEQAAAIKCLWPGLAAPDLVARFEQERQILARLEDTRIARLLDGGVRRDGVPWLALEYVDGEVIDAYCDGARLDLEARLALWDEVAAAVASAHRQLVVHRDLKPANVMVRRDGAVKLLDFGVAKLLDPDGFPHAAPATLSDGRALTRVYASPEQLRGEAVTTASDVYQLGLLLLELATGVQPFRGAPTPVECERRICEDVAPVASLLAARGDDAAQRATRRSTTPPTLARRLRGDFDAIVGCALAKAPLQRYASVDALRADVADWCAGRPVRARRTDALQRARKWLYRHRWLVLALAVITALAGAWLHAVVSQSRRLEQEAALNRTLRDYLVGWFQTADPGDMASNDPRASQMLAGGLANAHRDLGGQPELQAAVIGLIGEVYMARGDYALAEPAIRDAHALYRALPDLSPQWRGAGTASLATLMHFSGRYAEAESLFREALDERVAAVGESGRWTLSTRHYFGDLLHSRGRYREADEQIGRAYEGARATLGASEPLTAAIARNLADVRRDSGRYAQAERLYLDALQAQRAAHGETHPNTIASHLGYGRLLLDLGRYDEAAAQIEPAFALYVRATGADSPATAYWERVVAELEESRGALDAAAQRLQRIDASQRGHLPENHLINGYVALDAGYVALARGASEAAGADFARARRVFDAIQPLGHPRRIEAALGEALVAARRSDTPRADALLAEAQAQARAQLEPDHRLFAAIALARRDIAPSRAPRGLAILRVQRALPFRSIPMTMMRLCRPLARVLFATVGAAMIGAATAGEAPLPDLVLRDGFERAESADIRPLSDEFSNAATLGDWRRLWREEYWLRDPLDALDIGATLGGWITFVPATSTWYEDYVGELAFKAVAGDFVASARVRARARDGTGAPGSTHGGSVGSEFSLAGILVRAPHADVACCDPSWWQAGGERYVFLSFGAADQPGSYQLEAKTTRAAVAPETHSVSNLELASAQGDEAELRVARIGGAMLLLVREPGDAWRVHRRYRRDDFPLTLQVGMTVYTDWAIASSYPYLEHNRTHIVHAWNDAGTPGDPDLRAGFDWFRFARPQVPAALAGRDLADPGDVGDAELLAFLGDVLP